MDGVLAKLEPSLGRRWFGVVMLTLSGVVVLLFCLFQTPDSAILTILLVLLGAVFLWQAQWNLRVTKSGLYLEPPQKGAV